MPNTREKLIELLIGADDYCNDTCNEGCNVCKYNGNVDCAYNVHADHLISNGVYISQPCDAKPSDDWIFTNADRIRAMSVEELADWLVQKTVYQESAWSEPSYLNFLTSRDDTKENAIKGTVEWLKQPAEG